MDDHESSGGIEYEVDEHTLRLYARASMKECLNWLEEAFELVRKTSSEQTRSIREQFRKGRL